MKAFVEELVITYDGVTEDSGLIYEELGLDVIYDTHSMKIYSSSMAKIVSINEGIHVHTYKAKKENTVLNDGMGNKVVVTYLGSQTRVSVGIITSGGDAPGMNSAIRSIVRSCIRAGSHVFGVYRGFDGLINDYICRLGWDTETHNSSEGGTVLLSFRSKEFFTREGRKKAVYNLVKRGINSLIVLGGDGSLKGAQILKEEWRELFSELIKEGKLIMKAKEEEDKMEDSEFFNKFYGIPECYKELPKKRNVIGDKEAECEEFETKYSQIESHLPLTCMYDLVVVGIPASIDNDISYCDYTLGCDTALNRIVESIDHLSSTMKSHQRVFVIEVMGRKCGWLSLMSAYSCLADYLLIPEFPPQDWKREVLENIEYGRKHGKPGIFIIVSEGALDCEGNLINSSDIVDHIKKSGVDVRLLKLGHVQRGGPTSASDRILGTLSGIKAYEEVAKIIQEPEVVTHTCVPHYNKPRLPPSSRMIAYSNGEVISIELKDVIYKNDLIKEYEETLNFESVLNQRGILFNTAHSFYTHLLSNKKQSKALCMEDLNLKVLVNDNKKLQNKYKKENISISTVFATRIGIMQCGKRASGMNTALNSVIQYCYTKNIEPLCVINGFERLLNDQVIKPEMYEFGNDFNNGGSILGLGDVLNMKKEDIKRQLKKYNMKGLIIIGDPDSLQILSQFNIGNFCSSSRIIEKTADDNKSKLCDSHYSIILVPASSSNNFPCTDFSIGTDTALNTILKVSDCAKLSSLSLKRNVFVLEVSGGQCGYLTCMGAIAAGAFDCFIPERKYLISHLSETAHRLRINFKDNKRTGTVIFRNETTFCSISTEAFCKVLETDGMSLFDTDYGVLGRLQQGLNPSPIDRINASLLGFKAVDYCTENNVGMVGIQGSKVVFSPIEEIIKDWDNERKREINPKWVKFSNICKSLE